MKTTIRLLFWKKEVILCDYCNKVVRDVVYEDGLHFCTPIKNPCFAMYCNLRENWLNRNK